MSIVTRVCGVGGCSLIAVGLGTREVVRVCASCVCRVLAAFSWMVVEFGATVVALRVR